MNESSAAAALGDLLEQMKQRSKFSYAELARKTFTSSSTLHRYCAGRSVPPDAAIVTRIVMACGANQRELREALQAWLVADGERRQGPASAVMEYSKGDAVRAAEPPAIPRAARPARRRRYRGVGLLATLAVLLTATTSASVPPPAGKDATRQQWITGPSWARAPMPVKSTFFGVTIASDLGEMPSFKTGAVRFWDSETRWAAIQPRRGEFDWTPLDRLVAGANHYGLPTLFVLGGTPEWAAPTARKAPYEDGSRAAAPDDMRDWTTFVRTLVSRYRGRIEAYELWVLGNDPRFFNGPTETLVEMTRQADIIIKKADPKATVVCPGMGQLWKAEGRRVLRRFAELGGYQYCDVASIKLYQQSAADPPETMLKILQVVDDVMRSANIRPPLWSTGTTYDIALQKRLDEQRSINYAVRYYLTGLYGIESNLRRMYFYSWGNTKIPLVLQAAEGAPTHAALAVETLQRWLAHARIRACGQGLPSGLPSNVWQCEFIVTDADGTHPARIRWTSTGTADTVAPPRTRMIRRLDGSVTPVRPGDALPVGEQPLLIE
jgi:hypothetical protein